MDVAGGLFRVSVAGGSAIPLTRLDASRHEHHHCCPQLLPDGRHFLFHATAVPRADSAVRVGSIDSKETRILFSSESAAVFAAPDHILFVREGTLMAQRFDAGALELKDSPVPVSEGVLASRFTGQVAVSASQQGVLAWQSDAAGAGPASQLLWFDRSGKRVGEVHPAEAFRDPALSRDGTRIAANRFDAPSGPWWAVSVIDIARGVASQLTFDQANDWLPIWSPDGSRVVFASERAGVFQLYEKRSDGAGREEPLLETSRRKSPMDWSSDGRFIVYEETDPKTGRDLWILPLTGERKPFVYLRTDAEEIQGQFSPDSRWIAYSSDESGRYEIYVQPFPATGAKWPVDSCIVM